MWRSERGREWENDLSLHTRQSFIIDIDTSLSIIRFDPAPSTVPSKTLTLGRICHHQEDQKHNNLLPLHMLE